MKDATLIFDYVNLLHYKYPKINVDICVIRETW